MSTSVSIPSVGWSAIKHLTNRIRNGGLKATNLPNDVATALETMQDNFDSLNRALHGIVVTPPAPSVGAASLLSTFVFGRGIHGDRADIIQASDTNLFIAKIPGTLFGWDAIAQTAPLGADLIFDIFQNGTSIFSSTLIHIPNGSTALHSGAGFAATTVVAGDLFRAVCTQVGSASPGQSATINLYWM
jgi:hypothetical protein